MTLISILFLCLLILAFLIIRREGGIKNNFILFFIISIYTWYNFIVPVYNYSNNITTVLGNNVESYFIKGMELYLLGIFVFLMGYIIVRGNVQIAHNQSRPINLDEIRFITYLVYIFIGLNIINFLLIGAPIFRIFNVFDEDAPILYGTEGFSNYLLSFADSLVAVLIIAFIFKVQKYQLITWTIFSIVFFLLLGFRYRILLLLVGYGISFFLQKEVNLRIVIILFVGIILSYYFVMFISYNRSDIYLRNFGKVSENPIWGPVSKSNLYHNTSAMNRVFYETSNSLTDFSVLKYFELTTIEHDFGETMFVYPFIRMTPSFLFEENTKPYPPPSIKIIIDSFGTKAGITSGSAVTNMIEYYIAFGVTGIVIFMFLFGCVVAFIQNKLDVGNLINLSLYVIITISLFQFITRGFLPQYLNHLIYFLIPWYILYRKLVKINYYEK